MIPKKELFNITATIVVFLVMGFALYWFIWRGGIECTEGPWDGDATDKANYENCLLDKGIKK